MTEVVAPGEGGRGGGRSEKADVNHPKFFDRYSKSIEQQPSVTLLDFILISYETNNVFLIN